MFVAVASALTTSVVVACGGSSGEEPSGDDPGGEQRGDGGALINGGDAAAPVAECAESTKDIYVIAADGTLHLFHPPTLEFTSKGLLRCPTGGATPTSMAIDRAGKAWVRHTDGSVWKVSTTDLSCEPTQYQPQDETFFRFGMGFATETRGGSAEVLYVADSEGVGLGRIDTTTHALTYIGPFSGDFVGTTAELTGTGDGKLYGFFTTQPAHVAEISKSNGSIIDDKILEGVFAGNAWAFSFYGGDFYIYTARPPEAGAPSQAGAGSNVTRYRPSDGTTELVRTTGFTIVGAGVSTCAPTTTPR